MQTWEGEGGGARRDSKVPQPRAVRRRGQGMGLGIPRKEKKEEVTSPLEWEGTHLSTTDAAAWAASGQHCRMKDGSGVC